MSVLFFGNQNDALFRHLHLPELACCYFYLLFFLMSFPGCSVVENAQMSLISDNEQFICLLANLVFVPKTNSSEGWSKMWDELEVVFLLYQFVLESILQIFLPYSHLDS